MKNIKVNPNYIYIVALLICYFKLIYNADAIFDISLVDEHGYLLNGIKHKLAVEYAPLYSLWYYILCLFSVDNIQVMFLNFKLLTILFPLFIYWFLRKLKLDPALTFLLSFLLLISRLNFPIAPKVTTFMNIFQVIILYISTKKDDKELRNIFIAFWLFISYYIRPEYKISFFLFFLYLILNYVYQFYKGKTVKRIMQFSFLIIAFILLSFFVGFPFSNQSGKQLLAFGQHFSTHYITWNNLQENPFTNYTYILEDAFGKISSPLQALFSNPALFMKHVLWNVRDYVWIFIHLIGSTFFPFQFFSQSIFTCISFVLFIAGLVLYYFQYYKLQFEKDIIKRKISEYGFILFVAILLIIPNIISVLIVAPRYHYISLQLPVFTVLIVIAIDVFSASKNKLESKVKSILLPLFFSIIAVVLTPLPTQNELLIEAFGKRLNLVVVKELKDLHLNNNNTINSLNCDLIMFAYNNVDNTHYIVKQVGENNVVRNLNWNKFLKNYKCNFICVNQDILNFKSYKDDAEWQQFLVDYSSFGFVKIQTGSGSYYLIKKELLN